MRIILFGRICHNKCDPYFVAHTKIDKYGNTTPKMSLSNEA